VEGENPCQTSTTATGLGQQTIWVCAAGGNCHGKGEARNLLKTGFVQYPLGCNPRRGPKAGPLVLRYTAYSIGEGTILIKARLVFTAWIATSGTSKSGCKTCVGPEHPPRRKTWGKLTLARLSPLGKPNGLKNANRKVKKGQFRTHMVDHGVDTLSRIALTANKEEEKAANKWPSEDWDSFADVLRTKGT